MRTNADILQGDTYIGTFEAMHCFKIKFCIVLI